MEKLSQYDLVILSDVGANTLMMTQPSFRSSLPAPDRCKAIRSYVEKGGSFIMIGGFMSFTGIEGKARYGVTPIADLLPVRLLDHGDRVASSEGSGPNILVAAQPFFRGLRGEWSYFIGYNKTLADDRRGTVLASIQGDPLIAVGEFGRGRSAVFTSDCAPHWAPRSFLDSPLYFTLWKNMADWGTRAV